MKYLSENRYKGEIKGLVLDWSGTTADAYVIAPTIVFVEVFKKQKVVISMEEAREPMGLRKDLHIKALTENAEIRKRWNIVHGKDPQMSDVENMYADFVPLQLKCLKQYSKLLPGTAEVIKRVQNSGIKVGCTTGFVRSMVNILEEESAKQGYVPDASVAGDDVKNGVRPLPHMLYKNLDIMNIESIQSVIKVDDTVSGIGEAINAGCWGVGVTRYSNYMNINSLEEADQLNKEEIDTKQEHAKDLLYKAGAHYVIETIADIESVIDDINKRLSRGEGP